MSFKPKHALHYDHVILVSGYYVFWQLLIDHNIDA